MRTTRRTLLAASLAGTVGGVAAPALAAPGVTFTEALRGLRLMSSSLPHVGTGAGDPLDLSGALLVAPYGGLNWYFANLGLSFAAPHLSLADLEGLALPHLEAYLRNLTPDLTILDVDFPAFDGPVTPTGWTRPARDRDSDDSYAATALSLAARSLRRLLAAPAHRASALTWWTAHGPTLLAVARANLVDQIKADDLTATFRRDLPVPAFVGSRSEASVGYLMDNAEVHRGLTDLTGLLSLVRRLTGEPTPGGDLGRAATRVEHGLARLFDDRSRVYRPSDADRAYLRTPPHDRDTFYPWVTAQVFPTLMQIRSEDRRAGDAWRHVDAHDHRWSTWPNGAEPGRPDAYPWSLLALASLRRARAVRHTHPHEAVRRARQAARLVDAVHAALAERSAAVTVNEVGACLATSALRRAATGIPTHR